VFDRALSLGKVAIVRLRRAELALSAGDRQQIDESLALLRRSIADALQDAPADPLLWLVLLWEESSREGFAPQNLRYLRMSYLRGPYEGWIAVKRNQFALSVFPELSPELSEAAVTEFVSLVKSKSFAP